MQRHCRWRHRCQLHCCPLRRRRLLRIIASYASSPSIIAAASLAAVVPCHNAASRQHHGGAAASIVHGLLEVRLLGKPGQPGHAGARVSAVLASPIVSIVSSQTHCCKTHRCYRYGDICCNERATQHGLREVRSLGKSSAASHLWRCPVACVNDVCRDCAPSRRPLHFILDNGAVFTMNTRDSDPTQLPNTTTTVWSASTRREPLPTTRRPHSTTEKTSSRLDCTLWATAKTIPGDMLPPRSPVILVRRTSTLVSLFCCSISRSTET